VAALVSRLTPGGAVLELVNLSPFESRDVMVQAGTFGEHQFTAAKYKRNGAEETVAVNHKFFTVRLPAGSGISLDLGIRRFANRPTYAFPWHGNTVPVR
jgi:hypothetical protein